MLRTLTDSLDRNRHLPTLLIIFSTALVAQMIMLAARLIWRVPTRLLLFAEIILILCLASCWVSRQGRKSLLTRAVEIQLIVTLLIIWIGVIGTILGMVYRLDRAGWIWFQVSGYDSVLAEDYSEEVNLPIREFHKKHPIFSLDTQDGNGLILRRGVYDVEETIVIPRGTSLTIEPGTILRFHAGRSLISYSPIIARGTAGAPIRFKARNSWLKWGAVGVVDAGPSVFEHVRFEHGRRALINEIDLFGALSIINSEAEITSSEFVDLFGKDGVYVGNGRVRIANNRFEDAYKDGLDLDGGAGEISGNWFINSGDEGIDLSINHDLQVFDNQVLDPEGGRISADINLDAIIGSNTLGFSEQD